MILKVRVFSFVAHLKFLAISLREELTELEMFTEKWTHFKISLTEEGKIDFAFAYIPKDDYWPGLFMKGVSDLNKDELDTVVVNKYWTQF